MTNRKETKLRSNLQEVRARGGELYVFADAATPFKDGSGMTVVRLPEVDPMVTVRSCRYFGPEVAAARRSVRPVPDRACGSASVRANRVAMRFQCPTPFPTLAITPLRSASIAIWQALRTAPYRHDRTVTSDAGAHRVHGAAAIARLPCGRPEGHRRGPAEEPGEVRYGRMKRRMKQENPDAENEGRCSP